MTPRTASCLCGALSVTCKGDPFRISVCHCLDCQKRSGSSFAAQARFPAKQVTVTGEAKVWVRTADSGKTSDHHFCPTCGGELWYVAEPFRDMMAIPIGRFADPAFPPPEYSVYEERKHGWVQIVGDGVEHYD